MVRFAKNGSDATSAAIRLARAYTGKEIIAVSGYHGWHDWYIGTTTRDLGVPEKLVILQKVLNSIIYHLLKNFLSENKKNIAGVIIEPESNVAADRVFLNELREITKKNNIVLIFDEIVTGFRVNFSRSSKV